MPQVLIPFTTGVEEIEFVTVVDILRRAGITVCTASLDGNSVKGRSNITLHADSTLANTLHKTWDMIVLPGGLPNAQLLRDNIHIKTLILQQQQQQKWLAAICAGPTILAAYGITKGAKITSYPSFAHEMTQYEPTSTYLHNNVVVDGLLITSRGAGTALAFAFTLVEKLCGRSIADDVRTSIVA